MKSVCTELLGLQGWVVSPGGVKYEGETVIVRVERSMSGHRCSGCGEGHLFAYDHLARRRVRDLPCFGRHAYLEFEAARVDCARCGPVIEQLDWVEPNRRHTMRYERYVAGLCDLLPVADVVRHEGLGKSAVYAIDKKWLERRAAVREQHPVRYLGIDEIAIRRGHRYATLFYDLERREVIGMVKGRKQRAVSGFFRRWGKAMCSNVEAVCMDLWAPYRNSVGIHLKKATIVFDKFHVYSYLSDAIEQVRRNEQNAADAAGKTLIKGTRWLWLKKKLGRKQRQSINEIMAINANLQKAYLLKEEFEQFYAAPNIDEGMDVLFTWIEQCHESGLRPFIQLARRLQRRAEGVLAYFTHRITNGVAEGINNKVKVIKRRSYGFHDHQYFFHKILQQTGALPALAEI